jgi:glycosyltransferase involved in cell wall biosynthesis
MQTDCKLVIAGDSDHEDAYSRQLKARSAAVDRIVMPGYVTGNDLNQLYTHARLFVLPSYHEGLPIALLEALSYGLPAVVSDIPANVEVNLDGDFYYPVGDVKALREKLQQALATEITSEQREARRSLVRTTYDWSVIAEKTLGVYADALSFR